MMMNIKMMIINYDMIIMIIIILKMLAIMKAFYTLILLKTMMITLSSDWSWTIDICVDVDMHNGRLDQQFS